MADLRDGRFDQLRDTQLVRGNGGLEGSLEIIPKLVKRLIRWRRRLALFRLPTRRQPFVCLSAAFLVPQAMRQHIAGAQACQRCQLFPRKRVSLRQTLPGQLLPLIQCQESLVYQCNHLIGIPVTVEALRLRVQFEAVELRLGKMLPVQLKILLQTGDHHDRGRYSFAESSQHVDGPAEWLHALLVSVEYVLKLVYQQNQGRAADRSHQAAQFEDETLRIFLVAARHQSAQQSTVCRYQILGAQVRKQPAFDPRIVALEVQ